MLPSCVGFSASGELLVGEAARNQHALYPERTVRSIKRKMGSSDTVRLADKNLLPQEVSALILEELSTWAQHALGERRIYLSPGRHTCKTWRGSLLLYILSIRC